MDDLYLLNFNTKYDKYICIINITNNLRKLSDVLNIKYTINIYILIFIYEDNFFFFFYTRKRIHFKYFIK